MRDKIDIIIARIAIWSIKKGYGANCETRDTDDFPELRNSNKGRCASCRAREIIEWIEDHIRLIKEL